MSDPIRIEYVWSRENVAKLFDSSYRYFFSHSSRRYIGWFFIALLQFGVVAALKQGAVGLLMFSTLALLYWYVGKRFIARRRALASWEASPFRDKPLTILADDDGLEIRSDQGDVQWSWDDVEAVAAIGDDVMVYHAHHAHYIPESGFASIEDKSRFKTLARKHGKLQA